VSSLCDLWSRTGGLQELLGSCQRVVQVMRLPVGDRWGKGDLGAESQQVRMLGLVLTPS
jgi:hypothetical protein